MLAYRIDKGCLASEHMHTHTCSDILHCRPVRLLNASNRTTLSFFNAVKQGNSSAAEAR